MMDYIHFLSFYFAKSILTPIMRLLNMEKIIVCSLALFFNLIPEPISSQTYQNISKKDGLLSNNVRAIAQDTLGRIWLATSKGLNRYDGSHVDSYLYSPIDESSIASNDIRSIICGNDGKLYIGTNDGLSVYEGCSDSFFNYKIPSDKNTNQNIAVKCVKEDSSGILWVAGTFGLYKFNKTTYEFKEHFVNSYFHLLHKEDKEFLLENGVPEDIINKIDRLQGQFFKDKILFEKELLLLIGKIDYDAYSDKITKYILNKQNMYYPSDINTFDFDGDSICLGLANGVIVKISKNNPAHNVIYSPKRQGVETVVNSLLVSGDKIWFGTLDGVKILERSISTSNSFNIVEPKEFMNFSSPVFKTAKNGGLWIGAQEGLYRFDGKSGLIKNENSINNNETPKNITNLFIDAQNSLWISSSDDGLYRKKTNNYFLNFNRESDYPEYRYDEKVTSILVDKNNNTWVGYFKGGIDIYNKYNIKINSFYPSGSRGSLGKGAVLSIAEDRQGKIWIATSFDGLQFFVPSKGSFVNYEFGERTSNKRLKKSVFQIVVDSLNNKWLNVYGFGVYKINDERKEETHFLKDSLNDEFNNAWVSYIYLNKNNKLRFTIGNKLYELVDEYNKKKIICSINSSPNESIKYVFEEKNGSYWLGTKNGIYIINTNGLDSKELYGESNCLIKNHSIKTISSDRNNDFWVSTDHGLYRIQKFAVKGVSRYYSSRYFEVNDGLPSNSFIDRSFTQLTNGGFIFGTNSGFTKFNPNEIKKDLTKPKLVFTDFLLNNKSIFKNEIAILRDCLNNQKKIELENAQNIITVGFTAINYSNPERNQFAYKMVGVDDKWNYVGNKRVANYPGLKPGDYVFKVKAANVDGIWDNKGISLNINIKTPFWKTGLAYSIYFLIALSIIIFLKYIFTDKGAKKPNNNFVKQTIKLSPKIYNSTFLFIRKILNKFETLFLLIKQLLPEIPIKGIGKKVYGVKGNSHKKRNNEHGEKVNQEKQKLIAKHNNTKKYKGLPVALMAVSNDDVRNFLVNKLKNIYQLIIAYGEREVLLKMKENNPSIIICDIKNVDFDGIKLCEKIKTNSDTCNIPVALLSVSEDEDLKLRGYEAGADAIIVNPLESSILMVRLENLVQVKATLKKKYANLLFEINPENNIEDEKFVRKIIETIECNLTNQDFSIEDLCREIGYSRSALYNKMKAFTNLSLYEFIKMVKLKTAIEMFQKGNTSVSDVAFNVGFKTLAHFSRCFSAEFGISPSEYINRTNSKAA